MRRRCVLLAEVLADGRVVVGRVRKALEGKAFAALLGCVAVGSFAIVRQERRVVLRITQHPHTVVVLGSSTDECHAANVDFLDGLGDRWRRVLRDRLLERVQVAHHDIDRRNLVRFEVRTVGLERRTCQNAAVHGRMQGLDAAMQHLRGMRNVRHIANLEAGLTHHACRASATKQAHALGGKALGQLYEARLIVYGKDGRGLCHDGGNG